MEADGAGREALIAQKPKEEGDGVAKKRKRRPSRSRAKAPTVPSASET
jgi:hypothetical protein